MFFYFKRKLIVRSKPNSLIHLLQIYNFENYVNPCSVSKVFKVNVAVEVNFNIYLN